jgi:hypothetical protein
MQTLMVPSDLRTKLGPDAADSLVTMFAHYHEFATDRFERRLTELSLDLRVEMERSRTDIRVEMERMRSDVVKWNLVFWIGQFAALTAVLSFLLGARS